MPKIVSSVPTSPVNITNLLHLQIKENSLIKCAFGNTKTFGINNTMYTSLIPLRQSAYQLHVQINAKSRDFTSPFQKYDQSCHTSIKIKFPVFSLCSQLFRCVFGIKIIFILLLSHRDLLLVIPSNHNHQNLIPSHHDHGTSLIFSKFPLRLR